MNAIIDTHAHLGTGSAYQAAGSAERVLKIMDDNGIGQSIISPMPDYPTPDGIKDSMVQNDHIAQAIKKYPDRFPRGLGVVQPRHGDRALPEVDRIMEQLGLSGLAFDNNYSGLAIDNPAMFNIFERAAKYKNVIVMVHTNQYSILEVPFQLGKVVGAFPDITFIAAHPMMSSTHRSASIELAKTYPNLYFDICASSYHQRAMEKAVAAIGEDRLLFGSDNPYYSYCMDKAILLKSNVSEEAKNKIFYKNAKKLFGL